MELEQDSSQLPPGQINENDLVKLIINTFKGRTQAEVKQAEMIIVRSLNTPGMLPIFVNLLTSPS